MKNKLLLLTNHKIIKTTHKTILISLQVVLFLLLPIIIFTLLTSKTDVIRGIQSFVVLTGSMEPAFPVGSIIYVQPQIAYAAGDIIAFKNEAGQTITHRIADIQFAEGTEYITKGDANNTQDTAPVPSDKVVGKAYFHIPYVGYFINYLKTPKGFGLLVILPTALFILSEIWGIKKEIDKHIERKIAERLRQSIV